ncbi:aminoglycoside phosphotransferase family protein [Nocardiopsis sp. NPDC058789]|uniref:aminoglycoside phosphotransferase family protein n=1 Tax=Nocardiopsis sp. NPDC058789 TaxID=3346634 RepID=UPI0036722A7C
MTAYLTPEQLAQRTSDAVSAVVGAGRDLGLTVTDPRVLHDLFSVVVHLAPAPVVARVPTVLPDSVTVDSVTARQRAELDVTRWLSEQGTPVLRPSPLVPCEPVQRDGLSITFWEYVEERRGEEPDYVANAESVPALHAALRDYPGELEFLGAAEPPSLTAALERLEESPDLISPHDLARARDQWRVLEPIAASREAFERAYPGIGLQPIHGDSPPANVFSALDGDRHADFELVSLGPVEWDLAALGPELEAAYDRGARRVGTRELDRDVLAFVNAVGALRVVAALELVPKLPVLAGFLNPAVDQWRATPFTVDPPGPTD